MTQQKEADFETARGRGKRLLLGYLLVPKQPHVYRVRIIDYCTQTSTTSKSIVKIYFLIFLLNLVTCQFLANQLSPIVYQPPHLLKTLLGPHHRAEWHTRTLFARGFKMRWGRSLVRAERWDMPSCTALKVMPLQGVQRTTCVRVSLMPTWPALECQRAPCAVVNLLSKWKLQLVSLVLQPCTSVLLSIILSADTLSPKQPPHPALVTHLTVKPSSGAPLHYKMFGRMCPRPTWQSDHNASWWSFTLVFSAVHSWSASPRHIITSNVNRVLGKKSFLSSFRQKWLWLASVTVSDGGEWEHSIRPTMKEQIFLAHSPDLNSQSLDRRVNTLMLSHLGARISETYFCCY